MTTLLKTTTTFFLFGSVFLPSYVDFIPSSFSVESEIAKSSVKNETSKEETKNYIEFEVTITAYTPSPDETDSTPDITASNKKIQEHFIAVSRDIHKITGFGKKAKLIIYDKQTNSCGANSMKNFSKVREVQIEDLMNKRFTQKVDIVFFSKSEAFKFGKCKGKLIIEL